MKILNSLFEKYCPCFTHKMERDIKKKHKEVKSVKKVEEKEVDNICSKCGKTINGLKIKAVGTSIEILCARCKDAKLL